MTSHRDAPTTSLAARELLTFYQEAGVDALVGEAPVDRLAAEAMPVLPAPGGEPAMPRVPPAAPATPAQPPRTISARDLDTKGRGPIAPPSSDAAVMAAREVAKSAGSLEELRAILERFEGCALRNTATRLVFADGHPGSRLMFVGEAPGRDEDIQGLPFVGRSGQLLDRMIAAIGLDRSKAYIANVIPWRPPGNRTPTPQETLVCLPFIQRQIELVNPDVLVTLGNPSTQSLLGTREGIMRTRGKWFDYDTGTRTIRALPTFHPAYLLRSPSYKRMSWQDLRAIAKVLAV